MDTLSVSTVVLAIATIILVGVTAWYAHSTRKMLNEMRGQGKAMQEHSALMLKSIQVSAYNALMIRHAALLQLPRPSLMSIDDGDVTDKLKELLEDLEKLEKKLKGKV